MHPCDQRATCKGLLPSYRYKLCKASKSVDDQITRGMHDNAYVLEYTVAWHAACQFNSLTPNSFARILSTYLI
jgi:hypothetical protein